MILPLSLIKFYKVLHGTSSIPKKIFSINIKKFTKKMTKPFPFSFYLFSQNNEQNTSIKCNITLFFKNTSGPRQNETTAHKSQLKMLSLNDPLEGCIAQCLAFCI